MKGSKLHATTRARRQKRKKQAPAKRRPITFGSGITDVLKKEEL
jgi:hypothetical protein